MGCVMRKNNRLVYRGLFQKSGILFICMSLFLLFGTAQASSVAKAPLFLGGGQVNVPPLTMLVMGRDHTLYYEAYNDASDLTGDGVLNVGYQPDTLDYFGYFNSHLCYTHDGERFNPVAQANGKKCTGSDQWSGDFLNYVTTARIDALRKVLYGGKRFVDEENLTVLERSYIPQDAHSWGKEYESIARDGYDIRDYTPLSLPVEGTRHLFANTTLLKDETQPPYREADMAPLMRVLTDSRFRIWEWVAIERPVAGSRCISGNCVSGATELRHSHPMNASEFQNLFEVWGTETQRCGSAEIATGQINTSGSNNNPFASAAHCGHDYYLTRIEGQIYAATAGNYTFSTNGDDAVELRINGEVVSWWYGGHGRNNLSSPVERAEDIDSQSRGSNGTVTLTVGWHDFEFLHEEGSGGDNYELLWQPPSSSWAVVPSSDLRGPSGTGAPIITTFSGERSIPASAMTDYEVRVSVCAADFVEDHCRSYADGVLKPVGLLQQYGEDEQMLFGLLTGSYTHPYNMRGGILRKNIESFVNEVDLDTGIFNPDIQGIISTLDHLRIIDFDSGSNYQYRGGWLTNQSMGDSSTKFPDWGNPIAEMMYETVRYFMGKSAPTSEFMPSLSSGMEDITVYHGDNFKLPAPDWQDPFTRSDHEGKVFYCSPGAQLVISDVNPSFDTEFIPGSFFNSSFSGDIAGLNAANEAQEIWNAEYGGPGLHFIGESGSQQDGNPTPKTVTSLGNIRGLAPSEPTRRGGYYSAALARYGFLSDLREDLDDKQNINTFTVALASPLPKIEIPVVDQMITVVPFAKSVGQGSTGWVNRSFQPTNTIVDFFVDTFANTDPLGSDANPEINGGRPLIRFRINYEDVEQGADHDMDAIVLYELRVNADDTLTIELTSEYAAGGIIHHMGYVISGTTADGVYLEVLDLGSSNMNFALDTPPGLSPGDCAPPSPRSECNDPLPFFASRVFSASTDPASDAATVLENPLWYAAKYGSKGGEELGQGEVSPNYFLVTNASNLQQQLSEAFERIRLLRTTTFSSMAANARDVRVDTRTYQAVFDSEDWTGKLVAYEIDEEDGYSLKELWNTAEGGRVPEATSRIIITNANGSGSQFLWSNLTSVQQSILKGNDPDTDTDEHAEQRLQWIRGVINPPGPGELRIRSSRMGAFINSNPYFTPAPRNLGYAALETLPSGGPPVGSYELFLAERKDRAPMIYVGSNGGMLHGFKAETGQEVFAFVPNAVYPQLYKMTDPEFDFEYSVDGSPFVGQAYIDGQWRSILFGTLGAGGRGIFALDVTNPDSISDSNFLWEVDALHSDYTQLGYLVGQVAKPVIAKMANGDWAAVVGNGYSDATGASLFIINLEDGSLIRRIEVDPAASNGLSAPTLILDGNGIVAGAYAGDLEGNVWKFDLTGNSPTAWDVAFKQGVNPRPIFTASNNGGYDQAITSAIEIARHPNGGIMLLFGTGRFFGTTDLTSTEVQTLYGLWDTAKLDKDNDDNFVWIGGSRIDDRSDLVEQDIRHEVMIDDREWLTTTRRVVNYGQQSNPTKRGWYLDLESPDGGNSRTGSRVIDPPQLLSGRVHFTAITPIENQDPCALDNGKSTIIALDMFTGGRTEYVLFDVDDDGLFTETDMYDVFHEEEDKELLISYSGYTIEGMTRQPQLIRTDDSVLIYTSDTASGVGDPQSMSRQDGRQSWRQLR